MSENKHRPKRGQRTPVWPPAPTQDGLQYRPATPEDAVALAPRLRASDLDELARVSDRPIIDRLLDGIRLSDESWSCLKDDEVIGIIGVGRNGALGTVWMLCAPEVEQHPRLMLEHPRAWLASIESRYSTLCNAVSEHNTATIEWLQRLGFTVGDACPGYGKPGEVFRIFYRRLGDV